MSKPPEFNLETACKLCTFAEWDGNLQTGCQAGQIEKIKKAGYEVVEATDDESDFYVINNFQCAYFNTKDKEKTVEQKRKDMTIRYQTMVFGTQDLDSSLKSLESVLYQDLPTEHVSFMRPGGANYEVMDPKLQTMAKAISPEWWRLYEMVDATEDIIIERILQKASWPYILVVRNGDVIEPDTIKKVDCLIHDDLKAFGAVTFGNSYLISYYVFRYCRWDDLETPVIEQISKEDKIAL